MNGSSMLHIRLFVYPVNPPLVTPPQQMCDAPVAFPAAVRKSGNRVQAKDYCYSTRKYFFISQRLTCLR